MTDIVLRIELLRTQPCVWRRVRVPTQINLRWLQDVIQGRHGLGALPSP